MMNRMRTTGSRKISDTCDGPLPDASALFAAAVADSARPDSDTTRDGDRKPEQTAKVFDPTIRGRTDQFSLKFRKPK